LYDKSTTNQSNAIWTRFGHELGPSTGLIGLGWVGSGPVFPYLVDRYRPATLDTAVDIDNTSSPHDRGHAEHSLCLPFGISRWR